MTTKNIKELIELCRSGQCTIKLEACAIGVVAEISASRGQLFLQTTEYLDQNDPDIGEKLSSAVKRVQ